ncbi:hypothetical protein M404DRAFT_20586 [Pisolithus tinctorius Marx 270]|uniref:Uncharacterized protein n=1 Tax=Pisolithus tinctorius Marx 270 TaxID=870435 RepID=A0A0C3PQ19_PISTI|nr:hypothetical protein M404DRAFT_20586 [Pisolithus tinctorius Marx 270]
MHHKLVAHRRFHGVKLPVAIKDNSEETRLICIEEEHIRALQKLEHNEEEVDSTDDMEVPGAFLWVDRFSDVGSDDEASDVESKAYLTTMTQYRNDAEPYGRSSSSHPWVAHRRICNFDSGPDSRRERRTTGERDLKGRYVVCVHAAGTMTVQGLPCRLRKFRKARLTDFCKKTHSLVFASAADTPSLKDSAAKP